MTASFNKGDLVRIGKFVPQSAADGYGELTWPEGQIGTIGAIYSPGEAAPYSVDFEHEDEHLWPSLFAGEELELVAA